MKLLYDTREAADVLGLPYHTVLRAIDSGELKATKARLPRKGANGKTIVGIGRWLITPEDLEDFAKQIVSA